MSPTTPNLSALHDTYKDEQRKVSVRGHCSRSRSRALVSVHDSFQGSSRAPSSADNKVTWKEEVLT